MGLDVICVGSATIDTIAAVTSLPDSDGRAVATTFAVAGGGPAATAAVALARLGARVGFCGVVGDDDDGRAVRQGFESEGVDTQWLLARPDATTARSIIVVSESTAARMIIAQRAPEPRAADVPVGRSTWLHVDQTGFTAAKLARSAGGRRSRLSVDAGNPIDTVDLGGIDLYVPTVDSLLARYPSAGDRDAALAAALLDGAGGVVATDGPRGAIVASAAERTVVPGFAADVASTLGAGDVFHGALLSGLVLGATLVDATRRANAVAALSCRALDARSAIPTADELDEFLHSDAGELARSIHS